ncbi:MAG: dienelactone hydrolase family protein, partial [Candidatus Acidiferrum sp.]
FVFYGPPPDKDAMTRIKAPVYGFYAGNDQRIGATVPGAIADMKAAGKTYEPVTYDGAGHGFMRAGEAPDAKPADSKARAEACARWKSLMEKAS